MVGPESVDLFGSVLDLQTLCLGQAAANNMNSQRGRGKDFGGRIGQGRDALEVELAEEQIIEPHRPPRAEGGVTASMPAARCGGPGERLAAGGRSSLPAVEAMKPFGRSRQAVPPLV